MNRKSLLRLVLCATTLFAGCRSLNSTPLHEVGLYSAGRGSAFLPYAQGLASYLATHGIQVRALETTGSIENIRKVNAETDRAAAVFMGSAYEAYTGSGEWTRGERFTNLRALFPMYDTSFQIAARTSSNIRTLGDLAGKRVGVGPAGGPAAVYFAGLLEITRIDATVVPGQPADLVQALIDGRIDGLWQGAPPPIPSLTQVLTRVPATVFGLTETEQASMIVRFPFLSPETVASETYAGQVKPIRTVGAWNFVLVHRDFPAADAYRLTKAVLGTRELRRVMGDVAAGTDARNAARNTFLPFHPGAARYYREVGLTEFK